MPNSLIYYITSKVGENKEQKKKLTESKWSKVTEALSRERGTVSQTWGLLTLWP